MKKLLIPIDFSKNSMNAVSFALKISEGKKHQLTFYTVSYHAKPKGAAAKGFLALQEDARKSDELELKGMISFNKICMTASISAWLVLLSYTPLTSINRIGL